MATHTAKIIRIQATGETMKETVMVIFHNQIIHQTCFMQLWLGTA